MKPLTERILKLAVCEDITYTQAIKKDPSLVDSSKNEILSFFAGEEKENARLLPLIKSLALIIEKQSEALEYALSMKLLGNPFPALRIDEALVDTQARLKELGCLE